MKLNHNKISCIKLVHLLYLYIFLFVVVSSDFSNPHSMASKRLNDSELPTKSEMCKTCPSLN